MTPNFHVILFFLCSRERVRRRRLLFFFDWPVYLVDEIGKGDFWDRMHTYIRSLLRLSTYVNVLIGAEVLIVISLLCMWNVRFVRIRHVCVWCFLFSLKNGYVSLKNGYVRYCSFAFLEQGVVFVPRPLSL